MQRPRRILSWNVRIGRPAPLVIAGIAWHISRRKPHVIVLLEATRYVPDLRDVFGKKWRIIRHRTDVVVLVRRDVDKPVITEVGHDVAWRGPHEGIEHQGRKFLQLDWDGLRMLAVHRVPGGPSGGVSPELAGGNKAAWRAENTLIASTISDGPWISVGDQNARPIEVWDWMAFRNLHPIVTGAKVDWAMARGATGRGRRLGRRGSDHPAVLYVFRPSVAIARNYPKEKP